MSRFVLSLICALAAGPVLAVVGGAGQDVANNLPFLTLGFVVGLAHALDADHIAAVAALMTRGDNRYKVIARGVAWGLGHTLALFVICSTVLLLGLTISDTMERSLELTVGAMIVALGLRVLWKLHRERIHIHPHKHNGTLHVHAHSHAGDARPHDGAAHTHSHPVRVLVPIAGVGLVHGAAGSAGLLVLTLASIDGIAQAMLAFAVFGVGSLIGMTLLTTAASFPLSYVHRGEPWMRTSMAMTIGALALFVGGGVMLNSLHGLMG